VTDSIFLIETVYSAFLEEKLEFNMLFNAVFDTVTAHIFPELLPNF
jgi:hypothetical protein